MLHTTELILKALSQYQFNISDEVNLHNQIADAFKNNGIEFKKEHRLSPSDIVDFFVDGVALEVKIKGRPMPIYRQIQRYVMHDEVQELVLATSKSMGLPNTVNGKPTYLINLSNNLLF